MHQWALRRKDPHEFDHILHLLLDELQRSTERIDYQRRRAALRGWCIDPDAWRWLTVQLPPPEAVHGREPSVGDRKRQSASLYVWSKVTGSEHTLAPHPLRDQQPPDVGKDHQ